MTNPLTRKLAGFAHLPHEDQAYLDKLCADTRDYKAGRNLIREGDAPEKVFLLVEGWAYRYKVLPDGRRQIMAYLIPGDVCDIHIFILNEMDHSIGLLSDAKVAAIPRKVMQDTLRERPEIAQALFWSTLVDEAILREWLVNIAQRDAYERIAHLFCELWLRMDQVGLVNGRSFAMPMTQEQLGDTMGLTSVHVNRTLMRMRDDDLITLKSKQLIIHDIDQLRAIASFNPNYLHLNRPEPPPGVAHRG